jgi:hypothetical protein
VLPSCSGLNRGSLGTLWVMQVRLRIRLRRSANQSHERGSENEAESSPIGATNRKTLLPLPVTLLNPMYTSSF